MTKGQRRDVKFIHKNFHTIMTEPETLTDEELWESIRGVYGVISGQDITSDAIDERYITDKRNLRAISDRMGNYIKDKGIEHSKTLSDVIMFLAGFWYNIEVEDIWVSRVRMWY